MSKQRSQIFLKSFPKSMKIGTNKNESTVISVTQKPANMPVFTKKITLLFIII